MLSKMIFTTQIIFWFQLMFSMSITQAQNAMKIGDKIPYFSLKDQHGEMFNSDDFIGNVAMVIYFYPKDDTPGCTREACGFRDSFTAFTDKNIKVIGISADDVKSHSDFAKKYNLPFTLLADTDNKVRKKFGVKSDFFGLIPGRVTYVVDKQGVIIYMYDSQLKAENHVREVIKAIGGVQD